MTDTQAQSQFSMWAMVAAPLILGSDPRALSATSINMLKNVDRERRPAWSGPGARIAAVLRLRGRRSPRRIKREDFERLADDGYTGRPSEPPRASGRSCQSAGRRTPPGAPERLDERLLYVDQAERNHRFAEPLAAPT